MENSSYSNWFSSYLRLLWYYDKEPVSHLTVYYNISPASCKKPSFEKENMFALITRFRLLFYRGDPLALVLCFAVM